MLVPYCFPLVGFKQQCQYIITRGRHTPIACYGTTSTAFSQIATAYYHLAHSAWGFSHRQKKLVTASMFLSTSHHCWIEVWVCLRFCEVVFLLPLKAIKQFTSGRCFWFFLFVFCFGPICAFNYLGWFAAHCHCSRNELAFLNLFVHWWKAWALLDDTAHDRKNFHDSA